MRNAHSSGGCYYGVGFVADACRWPAHGSPTPRSRARHPRTTVHPNLLLSFAPFCVAHRQELILFCPVLWPSKGLGQQPRSGPAHPRPGWHPRVGQHLWTGPAHARAGPAPKAGPAAWTGTAKLLDQQGLGQQSTHSVMRMPCLRPITMVTCGVSSVRELTVRGVAALPGAFRQGALQPACTQAAGQAADKRADGRRARSQPVMQHSRRQEVRRASDAERVRSPPRHGSQPTALKAGGRARSE